MGLTQIDNTPFRHSYHCPATLQFWLDYVAAANVAATKMDDQLACALESGMGIEETSKDILFSKKSILHSVIKANKKLKMHRRATLNDCIMLSVGLMMGTPIDEPVKVFPREKKGGALGVIHSFGLTHRTAQDLVARIMSRHLKPRPFQYGLRGMHKAVADVKKRVDAGYIYAARLDIKDFFGSFALEKLAPELPLPHEVVEHAVVGRHIEVYVDQSKSKGYASPLHTPHYDDLISLARRGIPPGSACSPIIAEFMISRLAWEPSKQVVIVNYCDDWLILALKIEHLDAAVRALTDAVSKLPGGHFELLRIDQGSAPEGFGFLGHHFQLVNGLVRTTVAAQAVFSLGAKLAKLDQTFSDLVYDPKNKNKPNKKKEALNLLAEMTALVKGWGAAFREADDVGRHTSWCEKQVAKDAADLGFSPNQVAAAIDASMPYHPTDYVLAG